MQEYVIIVAGGTGSRMKSDLPKQFLQLAGKAVLLHTIDCFIERNRNSKIIIACHPDYITYTTELLKNNNYPYEITIVAGGETRFHSVKNGLDTIHETNALIAIHDAARPLVSSETIERCFRLAKEKGNAVPVVPVNESLRKANETTNHAVERSEYRIVQTPQCFTGTLIKKAFEQEYDTSFTDDASVLEKAGYTIELTEGNAENIKITNPADLVIAEALLKFSE